MTEKRKPYKKGLKADYKGASPEQVTRVVLSYKRPVRHDSLRSCRMALKSSLVYNTQPLEGWKVRNRGSGWDL